MYELHRAVEEGNLNSIQRLIDAGADINAYDNMRCPPIYYALASKKFKFEVLKLLIDNKADINAREIITLTDRHSPLNLAVLYKRGPKVVEYLLKNGADIELSDGMGWTPLCHAAAIFGEFETVKILVENKAKIGGEAQYFKSPIHYAVSIENNEETIKYLFRRSGRNFLSGCKNTISAFSLAVYLGRVKNVKLLINEIMEGNGDMNACRYWSGSLLHECASMTQMNVRRALGFDYYALSSFWSESIKNERSYDFFEDLSGRLESIKIMFDNGFCPETKNFFGQTPLHVALSVSPDKSDYESFRRSIEVQKVFVEQYLKRGIDIGSLKDRYGRSPLDAAREQGNTEILKSAGLVAA